MSIEKPKPVDDESTERFHAWLRSLSDDIARDGYLYDMMRGAYAEGFRAGKGIMGCEQ